MAKMANRVLKSSLKLVIRGGCLLVVTVFLIFLIPVTVYYVNRGLPLDLALLQTFPKIPTAQGNFDKLVTEILSISTDDLLEADIREVWAVRNYPGCVRSGGELIYGSHQPYKDVVSMYSEALQSLGWAKVGPSPTGRERDESRHSFRHDNGSIHMSMQELSAMDNLSEYQTNYLIDIIFAEPSIGSCYG